MGSSPKLQKKAQLSDSPTVSRGDTTVEVNEVKDDSVSDADVAGLVVGSKDSSEDSVISQIDDALDESGLKDVSEDDSKDKVAKTAKSKNSFVSQKGLKVMYGLGKIAASLRSKGENFAADVVEATAMSINDDLKKEASEKKAVVDHLSKVASKLDKSGDRFAGDLVRTTIDNIIKK